MNSTPKKKLCWNCEGSISVSEENCRYCGVSVQTAGLDGVENSFLPPYKMTDSSKNQGIPTPPYANYPTLSSEEEKREEEMDLKEEEVEGPDDPDHSSEFKQVFLPMVFLFSGTLFFLFGSVLAIFSQNGVFTLSWNGTLWYVYLGLSLPLLILGWLTLQKLTDP